MTAIITNKFRVYNAKHFVEQFDSDDTTKNLYFFIAKSSAWDNDDAPDAPGDHVADEVKLWNEMISMKKILDSNVSHVIPRHDWDDTGNTKYIAYADDDTDFVSHPTEAEILAAVSAGTYTAGSGYVVTDEFNVYKCLFNNGGIKSTTKPTGRSTSPVTTADGYIWKYMYTVSSAEVLKYVTTEWIPVKTLAADDSSNQWLVQEAAVDGSIDIIKVTNTGSGYVNVINGATLVAGSSTGGTLPNTASALDNTYNNMTAFITAGPGAGQRRKITAYTGSTRQFTVETNWSVNPDGTSTIDVLPTVAITGNGTGALAKPTVSGGAITKIVVTAPGADYRVAAVTITGGGGSNAAADAIISPIGGHGLDAVQELGGYYVMLNVRLEYDEDDFPSVNDYRKLGIIANLRNYSDNLIATATTRSATKSLALTSVTGTFLSDETITSNGTGTPTGKIIEFGAGSGSTGTIRYFQDEDTGFTAFGTTQLLTGQTSGATATIQTVSNPEAKQYSGEILYVENRRPVARAAEQVEDYKIVNRF